MDLVYFFKSIVIITIFKIDTDFYETYVNIVRFSLSQAPSIIEAQTDMEV